MDSFLEFGERHESGGFGEQKIYQDIMSSKQIKKNNNEAHVAFSGKTQLVARKESICG